MSSSVPGLVIYIYTLSDPRTHEVRYVGQTANPAQRLKAHCNPYNAQRSTHACAWIRSLLAQGLKPAMVVIEFCDEATWVVAEQRQVALFRAAGCRLTNTTRGGDGSYGNAFWRGRKHTAASRRKMSESLRAAWERRRAGLKAQSQQPARGRPLSDAHRAKLSKALKGRTLSPEHRARVADAQRGKSRLSSRGERKTRARLSASQVEEVRRRYAAGGVTFTALAREYGVHRASIANVVRGLTWAHL